jgi:hypothetical protein
MYWYLNNLHNKTIPQNNLDDISRKKVQRNFAEFLEIKITLVVISFREIQKKSYFATTLETGYAPTPHLLYVSAINDHILLVALASKQSLMTQLFSLFLNLVCMLSMFLYLLHCTIITCSYCLNK